jgi:hypothetical protein
MTETKTSYPIDVLIDAGLVLLGTARESSPHDARSLVAAVGVLFGRGNGKRRRGGDHRSAGAAGEDQARQGGQRSQGEG